MPTASVNQLLARLETYRRRSPSPETILETITALNRAGLTDSDQLLRFHDALLFLCAFPPSTELLKRAEAILAETGRRIASLARRGEISPDLDPEFSGLAGTSIGAVFSLDLVRWLIRRFPGEVSLDWEEPPDSASLASLLVLLLPFVQEEANVEANVPYTELIRPLARRFDDGGLAWLIQQIEQVAPPLLRAPVFDSLKLWIRWNIRSREVTRTSMRRPPRKIFLQQDPLRSRRGVSIAAELQSNRIPVRKLNIGEGRRVLDMARAVLATRYRELYVFTYGDPSTVLSADCGRGLEILLIGIVPEKRLPLRAGFAPLILRNGIPIGYGDAFAVCERIDVSLNIFYAFRDGESAFALARLLKLYQQRFGSATFSIDPYQIGMGNEEAIASGAFWFYRKLGFRPTDPDVEAIAVREEQRMAKDPAHRSRPATLRRLARSAMVYDSSASGSWDRFSIRAVDDVVQRAFARSERTLAEFTEEAQKRVKRIMRTGGKKFGAAERRALRDLAPLLSLIPDLERWTEEEVRGLASIIRAKASGDETAYVTLTAGHARFRRALLRLGSSSRSK